MRKLFKYIHKKLILACVITTSVLALTGCGDNLQKFTSVTLANDVNQRFEANIDILDKLHNASLIGDSQYTSLKKRINSSRESFFKDVQSTGSTTNSNGTVETGIVGLRINSDGTIDGNTYKAFSWLRAYSLNSLAHLLGEYNSEGEPQLTDDQLDAIEADSGTQDNLNLYILGNYLASGYAYNKDLVGTRQDFDYDGPGNDNPNDDSRYISIVNVDTGDSLASLNLDFPIYVLSPNIPDSEMDSFNKLISSLNSGDNVSSEELHKYFVETNTNLSNILGIKDMSELIGESVLPTDVDGEEGRSNTPGIDLSVYQEVFGQDLYVGSLKFYEFNWEKIKQIYNVIGVDINSNLSTDKWIIHTKGTDGENAMYLMQYPVYYVKGFQDLRNADGSINKNKAEAVIEISNLEINLKTGNILYKDFNTTNEVVIKSEGTPYLTLGTSVTNNDTSINSSFFMCGAANVNIANGVKDLNGNNATSVIAQTSRIILKDYLELTYAPSFTDSVTGDSSGLVVLGRKLRLVNMETVEGDTYEGGRTQTGVNTDNSSIIEEAVSLATDNSALDPTPDPNRFTNSNSSNSSGTGSSSVNSSTSSIYRGLGLSIPLGGITYTNSTPAGSTGLSQTVDKQTKLVWDKSNTIAEFLDVNNATIDAGGIKITDLADIEALEDNKVILKIVDANSATEAKAPSSRSDTETVNGLPTATTQNYVHTTTSFPGLKVGLTDYEADQEKLKNIVAGSTGQQIHQQFYGMFVATDMFEKSLFSTWLNSSDKEASLSWWVKYLSDNGYIYNLSTGTVQNYLQKNYAYQLQQNGIIMLDLAVVSRIQDEMDAKSEANQSRLIRTMFKVLGWLLMIYSMVLFLGWLIDTNADFGLSIVNKLTIGHWEPVKDSRDVPTIDTEHRMYVNFSRLLISCITIILAGIILVTTDVYNLVAVLIKLFGVIAKQISKMLNGM